jgi:hypothetical protein
MLIYMAVPVSIMIGLCIFSYMAGRYVSTGKKQKLKEPDKAPMLEKENRILRESLESKSKELEKKNEAYDLIVRENQKLLARPHRESTDEMSGQNKEVEGSIEPAPRLLQPEEAPPAIDPSVHTVPSLYESVLKGFEEKTEYENPEEKSEDEEKAEGEEKPEGENPEEKVESENPEEKGESEKFKKKAKSKKASAAAKPKSRKKKR